MVLVTDAGVIVAACLAGGDGFALFGAHELIAPDLMWWEAASTLHEYLWLIGRGRQTADMASLTHDDVLGAFDRLRRAPVRAIPVAPDLMDETWRVADACGFAKLYDAACVALARVAGAQLVTLDGRLLRSPAAKLVAIVGPTHVTPPSTDADGGPEVT